MSEDQMAMAPVEVLSPKEMRLFQKNGFVVVREMLPAERVSEYAAEVERLTDSNAADPRADFYFEPHASRPETQLLRRMEHVTGSSKLLDDMFRTVICDGASQLFGEPACFFEDKLNMKLPGGAGFRAHLDGHFLWQDGDGRERQGWQEYASHFISVLVGLDPATRENGCLQVAPLQQTFDVLGSDFDELLAQVEGRGPEIRPEDAARVTMHHVETEPGDVVYLDWRIIHASDANHSDTSRRVLYGTYNRASEGDHLKAYYEDKRKSAEPITRKALG